MDEVALPALEAKGDRGDEDQIGIAMQCDIMCVVLFCVVFTLDWKIIDSYLFVFESTSILFFDARSCSS